jgi:hypothetical protein
VLSANKFAGPDHPSLTRQQKSPRTNREQILLRLGSSRQTLHSSHFARNRLREFVHSQTRTHSRALAQTKELADMTSHQNPYDSAYYSALAAHCFSILAPGIAPSEADTVQLDSLALELARIHNPFYGPMHFRKLDDDGLPLVQINDPFGRPLVNCWIEFSSAPYAFFYWES